MRISLFFLTCQICIVYIILLVRGSAEELQYLITFKSLHWFQVEMFFDIEIGLTHSLQFLINCSKLVL